MINNQLYRNPITLDRAAHRAWRVRPDANPLLGARALNSFFVAAVEFADVALDYAIVFVRAGDNPDTGKPDVAPMAVFGLSAGENLYLDGDRWTAQYVPAMLRAYPFALAMVDAQQYALMLDAAYDGFSQTDGQPLFADDGEPTPYLKDVQQYVERLEVEVQRTRAFGQRLVELDLLQDTRFEATLVDDNKLTVDGFSVVDQGKLAALPDAQVLELHKTGMLSLIHLHQASMAHMRRLVNRRQQRVAAA